MRYHRQGTSWLKQYRGNRDLLLMFLPCAATLLVFNYIPMMGLIVAFKDYRLSLGILKSPWVGWDHFVRLFSSEDFPRALRNTLIISSLRMTIGFVAPIVLALLLNEVRSRWFSRAVQTATYLPYFFSWVVLGGILQILLTSTGPINYLLGLFGIGPILFLSHDVWFIVMLILTGIWHAAGYAAVIYLAALAGINPSLYEAATVDGAGKWHSMWHVTLPCLVPTIIVLAILQVGYILSAGFDQVYNLYNPSVYDVSDIIDTYVIRRLMTMDFGLSTAAGMFKSTVGLILIISANWVARRVSGGEQGVW
ncbi:MAG: sugar ABC transporter permease [Gammaproteobacteria bacterium]|nr:MAG: sugar ABC transporter permease [Gammaproteobacteria bacterium]